MRLPRVYAIVDASVVAGRITAFTEELVAGGITLIQFRDKEGSPAQTVSRARELRRICPTSVTLIMNDRPDLGIASGCNGIHVGQTDISIPSARRLYPTPGIVGISAHNEAQVLAADKQDVDYIAVGPVFRTSSKADPDPVIGVEGVRRARAVTKKPLVAIGGITLENCRSVIDAGADSVAVISALLSQPRETSAAFLGRLL
jgi:thiamine-phosphate pyrophosphorylase